MVDCDKNLGDGLFDRSWVHAQCLLQLQKVGHIVSDNTFLEQYYSARQQLDFFIYDAVDKHILTMANQKFLFSRCVAMPAIGTFRIRAKVHKTPLESRPIANLTQSWVHPFAYFLCILLRPAVVASPSVVESSSQFLGRVREVEIPDDFCILVVDANDLYPSIEHQHLCTVVGACSR